MNGVKEILSLPGWLKLTACRESDLERKISPRESHNLPPPAPPLPIFWPLNGEGRSTSPAHE